jgi:hypothetical protein
MGDTQRFGVLPGSLATGPRGHRRHSFSRLQREQSEGFMKCTLTYTQTCSLIPLAVRLSKSKAEKHGQRFLVRTVNSERLQPVRNHSSGNPDWQTLA